MWAKKAPAIAGRDSVLIVVNGSSRSTAFRGALAHQYERESQRVVVDDDCFCDADSVLKGEN